MPLPPDAQQRLDALRRFLVVDAPDEDVLTRLVRVAGQVYGVTYAVLALRDGERERAAAAWGVDPATLPDDFVLCERPPGPALPVTVADASQDARFAQNPLVHGPQATKFYAGVPLKSAHGFTLGTLAVMDPAPQEMNGEGLALLVDLGALVEPVLNLRQAHEERDAAQAGRAELQAALAEATPALDGAQSALGTLQAERDAALQAQAATQETLEATRALLNEADTVAEAARRERDALEQAQEALRADRDAALRERDLFLHERDAAAVALHRRDALLATADAGEREGRGPDAFARLAEATGAVRAALFALAPGGRATCLAAVPAEAEGSPPLLVGPGQPLDLAEAGLTRWASTFAAGGPVIGPVAALPAGEAALLAGHGARHVAALPLLDGGRPLGFALFADGAAEAWGEADLHALRLALGGVAAALRPSTPGPTGALAPPEAQARRRFLAAAGYELRSTLTGILGYAEFLAEDPDPERQAMAASVLGGAERLLRTMGGLLDLARLDTASVLEAVDVEAAVADAAHPYRPTATARDLAFLTEPPAHPTFAWADATALARVLDVLLANAFSFTRQGGVRVRLAAEEDWVCVEVQDTGGGMGEEQLEQLFDPANPIVEREGGGSGLGLGVARQLVGQMSGRLDAHSVQGQGSVFRVILRAAAAPERASGPAAPAPPGGDGLASSAALAAAEEPT